MDQHPGVAVVDLDRDGLDDLYVIPHWGRNLFFRNRGDGTFEEKAAQVGLDVDGGTSSAVFADFDNDGDTDAFLGRTLQPSLYLENDGKRMRDASSSVSDRLPALVSSVTAVDVDRDGLLDVYFATYAAKRVSDEYSAMGKLDKPLLDGFIRPEESKKLLERLSTPSEFYDLPGPPNVLVKNRGGGKFAVASDSGLEVFANTYQATWADYDRDGDPDVYLANDDFGADNLLRNDGRGRFVDAAKETGAYGVGFGMGATWGDYDGDGLQDLYVSNMYSKAGKRITERLGNLDQRYRRMAVGNTLYRNLGDTFEDLSSPEALHGEKAGWSWAGQFADVDNDGRPDLHVLSGYYTAPAEYALPVDT
jgi:hypothetical protein